MSLDLNYLTQLGKECFTFEQVIEELSEAHEILDSIMNKYDYSKLPGRK